MAPIGAFYQLAYFLKNEHSTMNDLRAMFRAERNLRNAIPDTMTVEATLRQIIQKMGSPYVTDALRGLVPNYDKELAKSTSTFETVCGTFYASLKIIRQFEDVDEEALARIKILVCQQLYDDPECRKLSYGNVEHHDRWDLYTAMKSLHGEEVTNHCAAALIVIDRLDLLHEQ